MFLKADATLDLIGLALLPLAWATPQSLSQLIYWIYLGLNFHKVTVEVNENSAS